LETPQWDCGPLKLGCETSAKLSRCMKTQTVLGPLVQILLTTAREVQLAIWLGCYANTSKTTTQTHMFEM